MTIKKINKVPQNANKLGDDDLVKAKYIAPHFDGFVTKKWIRHIKDPSNYIPYYDERVIGDNRDQIIFYEVFATMNKEIPEPRP